MRVHRVLTVVPLLVLASACAQNEPKPSTASQEIARLEREVAGAAPSTVGTTTGLASGTLSPEFARAARDARKIIEEELRIGPSRNDETQFDADLARARAKLQEARGLASSDDERSVHLLLTLLLIKDKERYQTMFMSRRADVPPGKYDSAIAALNQRREVCAIEVRGWLFGRMSPDELREAPCMTEAREAAAMVGGG